ncbi:TraB/GumN family protein [Salinisphaera sp. T31B1]|uniref:TraB/GumN family protein n=1 Tax=Salinisphaera sp. T31B1 TaxID=727963 RepID=UPI00333F2195
MHRHLRLVVWMALFVGSAAQAQTFVWRIQGHSNTVYLAGALHLLPERAYPLPTAYERAYADSALLVVEADQDALQSDQTRRAMLAAARYDEGDLAGHLDADTYRRTEALLERLGLSSQRMAAARPWFVSMAIEAKAFGDAGFRGDLGLDGNFYARAQADGKTILPLQPVAAHLAVVTDMPEALSRDQLSATLDNADELAAAPQELYDFWHHGDVAGFTASVTDQADAYPALYDRLIFDRTRAWLTPITAVLHSPDNAMVLVGAAHLVGPHGLIALLRERGYDIRRLD